MRRKNRLEMIRSGLLVFLTHHVALPLLKWIRKPERFPFEMEDLEKMENGTLGKDLYLFLNRRNLPLLPHYARHDMKHILLDYDTTGEDEIRLQCFMLGNGHFSLPVAATVLYGYLIMPEHWKLFRDAYRRGKTCRAVENFKWFEIPLLKTADLKQLIAQR